MLVLGLDPGLGITGWALVEGEGGRLRLRDAGCWETPAGTVEGRRLLHLWRSFHSLVASSSPEEVALERLFFARNTTTAMAVSQARGVLVCAATDLGLPLIEYTPAEVKQAVTGSGSADKRQVAKMVAMVLGSPLPPGPDDLADACAVGICHQHASRLRRAVAAGTS